MGEEQIWTKRGSRIQLPRVPRPSRAILLRAIPSIGVVSLSLVGLLAVPAGTPPPPPAVIAAPTASSTPDAVETPTPEPSPTEITFSPDGDPPHCVQRAHPISQALAAGTIAYTDIEHLHVYLYDPATGKRTIALDGKGSCGFLTPRFLNAHTLSYNLTAAYIREQGSFVVDLTTGRMQRINGSRRDWPWLAASTLSPDGSMLAELGAPDQSHTFTLRVASTRTGAVRFSRSIGYICYCDGGLEPIEIRWSADGVFLSVAVPGETGPEVFVIYTDGRDARKPVAGSYPRWLGTTRALIYRDAQMQWVRVDTFAKPTPLFQSGSSLADPAISPDASKVVFWDTGAFNTVVYDFATKAFKRYGNKQAHPIWLNNGMLAVSGVKTCNCEGYGIEFTGAAWSITLRTGGSHRIAVQTFDADVLR